MTRDRISDRDKPGERHGFGEETNCDQETNYGPNFENFSRHERFFFTGLSAVAGSLISERVIHLGLDMNWVCTQFSPKASIDAGRMISTKPVPQ
jgi:hypothetical protein